MGDFVKFTRVNSSLMCKCSVIRPKFAMWPGTAPSLPYWVPQRGGKQRQRFVQGYHRPWLPLTSHCVTIPLSPLLALLSCQQSHPINRAGGERSWRSVQRGCFHINKWVITRLLFWSRSAAYFALLIGWDHRWGRRPRREDTGWIVPLPCQT